MLTDKDVRCDDQGFQIDAISSLYLEGHVWKPSVVLEPRVRARNPPFHIQPLASRLLVAMPF